MAAMKEITIKRTSNLFKLITIPQGTVFTKSNKWSFIFNAEFENWLLDSFTDYRMWTSVSFSGTWKNGYWAFDNIEILLSEDDFMIFQLTWGPLNDSY